MSDAQILNLLVVDRSLSDIEQVSKLMRSAGYVVNAKHVEDHAGFNSAVSKDRFDLVFSRQSENLPNTAEVSQWLKQNDQDVPILALVSTLNGSQPATFIDQGAENVVGLDNGDYLVSLAKRLYDQLKVRRSGSKAIHSLEECRALFRILLNTTAEPFTYIFEGVHVYANPAFLALFGYSSEADLEATTIVGMVTKPDRDPLKSFLKKAAKPDKEAKPLDVTGIKSNGSELRLRLEGKAAMINGEAGVQIRVHDLEAEAATAGAVAAPTGFTEGVGKLDALSGLLTRSAFTDEIEPKISQPSGDKGAMLYILISEYLKLWNECGLETVDLLIKDLGKMLGSMVGKRDVVGRFSDAAFLIHTASSDKQEIGALAEKIRVQISNRVPEGAQQMVTTTACIGIYPIPAADTDFKHIVTRANKACEMARNEGGDRWKFFSKSKAELTQEDTDVAIVEQIRDSILHQRLNLLFQPIASFADSAVERYKGHLKINDGNGQPFPLKEFADVAERNGLMGELDRWNTTRGISALLEQGDAGKSTALFIRLSENSIQDDGFVRWLFQQLKDTGVRPQSLVYEMAEESAEKFFRESKVVRDYIKKLGCGFALCHFGGREHSRKLMDHLKPEYVKLDIDLIDSLSKDEAKQKEMKELAAHARELNAEIVAEYVSSAPQLASIWQYGITLVQGDVVAGSGSSMSFDFSQFAG